MSPADRDKLRKETARHVRAEIAKQHAMVPGSRVVVTKPGPMHGERGTVLDNMLPREPWSVLVRWDHYEGVKTVESEHIALLPLVDQIGELDP